MKIFGIGFSRTGTLTLATALKLLGYRTVHCPEDLSVLDAVDAASDAPVAISFRELDIKYPTSKFILTTRDIDTWLRSMEWLLNHKNRIELYEPARRLWVEDIRTRAYGTITYDPQKLRTAYDAHLAAVRSHFSERPMDLLEMDLPAGDGWGKLCPFLGKQVPEVEFPHVNKSPNNSKVRGPR